jgi:hypothetical protein
MAKGPIFAAGLALAALTHSAQALPAGPADLGQDSLVTTVAEGCGRGWGETAGASAVPCGAARPAMAVPPS